MSLWYTRVGTYQSVEQAWFLIPGEESNQRATPSAEDVVLHFLVCNILGFAFEERVQARHNDQR